MTSPIRVSDEDTIFYTIHAFPDLLAHNYCLFTEACRLTLANNPKVIMLVSHIFFLHSSFLVMSSNKQWQAYVWASGDEDKMFGTDLKSFAPLDGFAISELSANWLKSCTAQSLLLILWHTMLMVSNPLLSLFFPSLHDVQISRRST
jgi:hypothetical protein